MPLIKGYSRATISKNIKFLMKEGRTREQAVAIAMDIAREAAKKAKKSPKHLKRKK
jgi:hypothetical protein